MPTNPESIQRQVEGKVEYEWGTLWPHHPAERMNWGTGFRTMGDVDILFLSGSTGRDPFADRPTGPPTRNGPVADQANRERRVGAHHRETQ